MNMHSEIYNRIRDNIIRTWPAWKRKIYNSCFAVSTHAEKLPEDDITRSTPVWTNYDRIISKTPEKMVEWIESIEPAACPWRDDHGDNCRFTHCRDCWLDWLKAPADKEG